MKIVTDKAHLSLKLMKETHKKLKVLSALSGKSITTLIEEWIDQQNPDVSGLFGSKKKRLKRRKSTNAEMQSSNKSVKPTNEEKEEIKKAVLRYNEEGKTTAQIAVQLHADGMPTLTGKGVWTARKVRDNLKKWSKAEPEEKAEG
jgi:hypothetical protein